MIVDLRSLHISLRFHHHILQTAQDNVLLKRQQLSNHSLKTRTFNTTMFYLSNCAVPLLFCFVNSFIAGLLVITSAVVKFRFISANFFIVFSYSYLTIVYFLWSSAEVSSDSCKKKELFWIKLSTKNGYHSECPIQIKFSVQQIPRCQ